MEKVTKKFLEKLTEINGDESQAFILFKDYINKVDYNHVVSELIARALTHRFYGISGSTDSKVMIGDTKYFSLSLDTVTQTEMNTYLYSAPSTTFISPINNHNPLLITKFKRQNKLNYEIFDSSNKLEIDKEIVLEYRDVLKIEREQDIVLFNTLDSTKCYFSLASKNIADFSWEYRRENLSPTRIVSVNANTSRLKVGMRILTDIGNKDSIKVAKELCNHENHTVRWEAVKCLINLNFDSGKLMLEKMIDDNHPEIRKASAQSLKTL